MKILLVLLFSTSLYAQSDATCLKAYDRHLRAAKTATVTIGTVGIIGSAVAIAMTGPFGLIPLAIAGGVAATSFYYKRQYEKAWFLLKEAKPRSSFPHKYTSRIAANSGLRPQQVIKIIWKNEAKFCKGATPWTYRKIRKAIKKKKLTL